MNNIYKEVLNLINKMGKMRRIESPNSINTYKQCPRKYYYAYIRKLETVESIHTIRGKIVHSTLEDFFKVDITKISNNSYEFELKAVLFDLFRNNWIRMKKKLMDLTLDMEQIGFYYEETRVILGNWIDNFINKLDEDDLINSFLKLRPITEEHIVNEERGVRGIIDAIHDNNGEISILDYKTSKNDDITDEHKLQLAIYAMLYYEQYGKMPGKVGIDFLKFGEKFIDVDEELIEFAKKEIEIMHFNTQSDKIEDYEKIESGLCRWNGGSCDFYDVCSNE